MANVWRKKSIYLKSIKQLSLVALLVLLSSEYGLARQKVEVYGDDNYRPYSYIENGKPQGIYVDVLKLAFSRMPDYQVTIKMLPWKRGIKYIKEGKGFALFPPYYTEKRDSWMLFSETILKEQVVVFGLPEALLGRTKWPEDYYGTKIGLTRGYNPYSMGGFEFGEAVRLGHITIEEATNSDSNLRKLVRGRIDFYINDQMIDTRPYPSVRRGIVANTNYGYLGFTKQEQNYPHLKHFKRQFDAVIRQMKSEGIIDLIIEHHKK